MKNVTETIKEELIKRCENYEKKTNYNYWENHIKYVVKNAKELQKGTHPNCILKLKKKGCIIKII
ncbi:MAG: hypothetical protein J6J60_08135 [Clostridia bacterium]|nr:hypothetical protein [Clostridia bacterium]